MPLTYTFHPSPKPKPKNKPLTNGKKGARPDCCASACCAVRARGAALVRAAKAWFPERFPPENLCFVFLLCDRRRLLACASSLARSRVKCILLDPAGRRYGMACLHARRESERSRCGRSKVVFAPPKVVLFTPKNTQNGKNKSRHMTQATVITVLYFTAPSGGISVLVCTVIPYYKLRTT